MYSIMVHGPVMFACSARAATEGSYEVEQFVRMAQTIARHIYTG